MEHTDHWWLLIAAPLNFTHKAAAAAVFGYYGLERKSWEQVGLLIAMQVSSSLLYPEADSPPPEELGNGQMFQP